MKRWLILILISSFVVSGLHGCVLVVADEDTASEIKAERSRSRLSRDIEAAITSDNLLHHSDIEVSEHNGVVILSGEVDSMSALQRAIDIAAQNPAVDNIRLRLTLDLNN